MSFYRIQELGAVTNGKERWCAIDRKHGTREQAERAMRDLKVKRPTARFRIRKVVRW